MYSGGMDQLNLRYFTGILQEFSKKMQINSNIINVNTFNTVVLALTALPKGDLVSRSSDTTIKIQSFN
jgi:hypothetical protein